MHTHSDSVPVLRPALILFIMLSVICCGLYPAVVTLMGQTLFPQQASGSWVTYRGQIVGSNLIGQNFSSPRYFWGRPSATSPTANNAAASSGSNVGPTNPALVNAVKKRIAALRAADPANTKPIPVDLVTTSASGLDPEISLAAAYYQAGRIARERHLSLETINKLIDQHKQLPFLAILGEPRVNVLELNIALGNAV